jgi:Domain of unknown function (DUF5069)
MGPLDLEKQMPRGPREQLAGLYFMARTVDKLRAEQPGGKLGLYLNRADGVSAYMCKRVGLDMEELRGKVAAAGDEAELEAWLRERLDPALVAETNGKLEALGTHRLAPESVEMVKQIHPIMHERPELTIFFDIFDADEASRRG